MLGDPMEAFRFERRMESESPKSIYNCFAIPVLASLPSNVSAILQCDQVICRERKRLA